MDDARKLRLLLDVAESIGIEVRRVSGMTEAGGSLVRIRGKSVLFLDPSASDRQRLDVVAGALRDRPELEDQWLPPAVRDLLE
jgi:hypothetical protein